jgi:hypothetical protein
MKSSREVLDLLEHVRSRKDMYFEHVNSEAVENFIVGFVVACGAADIPLTWSVWHDVADARGWQADGRSPVSVMRERGLSDDLVADELFQILIAAVGQVLPAD